MCSRISRESDLQLGDRAFSIFQAVEALLDHVITPDPNLQLALSLLCLALSLSLLPSTTRSITTLAAAQLSITHLRYSLYPASFIRATCRLPLPPTASSSYQPHLRRPLLASAPSQLSPINLSSRLSFLSFSSASSPLLARCYITKEVRLGRKIRNSSGSCRCLVARPCALSLFDISVPSYGSRPRSDHRSLSLLASRSRLRRTCSRFQSSSCPSIFCRIPADTLQAPYIISLLSIASLFLLLFLPFRVPALFGSLLLSAT
jgi:hypothetical protein